jgi:hypothetical protein
LNFAAYLNQSNSDEKKLEEIHMKNDVGKRFTKIGLLVVMIMIAAGTSANAQTLQYKLTANIPFDFTVADKKFEAGEYSFGRAQQTAGDTVVQIRSTDGHASLNRLTVPVLRPTPEDTGTLVFHRYGDEYFLFQIWPAGASTGRALPKSRDEKDAERKVHDNMIGMAATKKPKTEIVTVVADQP